MPLTPIPYPGFGQGLDLQSQVDVVSPEAAIDCLNVTFTQKGAVESRAGYGLFTAVAGTNKYDSMIPYYTTSGTRQLVVGAGNRLEGLSSAGAVVASSTAPTANPHFFTRFGGPTAEVVYAANGADALRQWNGSAWSTPAWTGTSPTGKFVAVTPWDNRLVCARYATGTAGVNQSSVRFSDNVTTGAPLNFGANNYVDLTPGDGEPIMGMIAWRGYLFVFKQSKFFRFSSTTTDSTGNPVFNYDTVDTGIGMCSSLALCAGRDGVYFMDDTGIYRTTGGPPVDVSEKIAPFFTGGTSDFFLTSTLNRGALTQPAMAWHNQQVFVSVPTGTSSTNDRVFVFDTTYGWWTVYDLPAQALASFEISAGIAELVFALSTGTKDIGRHSSSYTTDNGTAITSRWNSGWYDFKDTAVKSVRELKAWGKGTAIVGVNKDFTVAAGGTVCQFASGLPTWGGSTWGGTTWSSGESLNVKQVRGIAKRGTVFSLAVASSAGSAWSLNRLTTHIRSKRTPSITRTEA